ERLGLIGQVDYHGKLSRQFPVPSHRVVYNKSGMYLAAVIVCESMAVIDQQLYWGAASSLDEARYLVAILNSNVLTIAVRHLQARGEHNPRHFDKLSWELPIPAFDAGEPSHRWLIELAEHAERVASDVPLPSARFETKRRRIRQALDADGVAADIDAI